MVRTSAGEIPRNGSALVVVADAARAQLYETDGGKAPLIEIDRLSNDASRKPERDLVADAGGRRNHRPTQSGASAYGSNSVREHFAERFAAQICSRLESQLDSDPARRIFIVAAPQFLGLLRQRMPTRVQRQVAGEVPKDMAKEDAGRIRALLDASL